MPRRKGIQIVDKQRYERARERERGHGCERLREPREREQVRKSGRASRRASNRARESERKLRLRDASFVSWRALYVETERSVVRLLACIVCLIKAIKFVASKYEFAQETHHKPAPTYPQHALCVNVK